MAQDDGRRRWTQSQRLEFIEWKLYWDGHLNRSDLEDKFGISTPQASVDLRNYRDAADENIEYNSTEKRYLPSLGIAPKYLRVSADRLLLQLRAWLTGALQREDLWFRDIPPVDMAPDIARNVDAKCLRKILEAMRVKKAISVRYQSLTNSRWRDIAPHALAFDGHRWHVRAWSCDRRDFRDFVLTRIDKLGEMKTISFDPEHDVEWHTTTSLKLCPHPDLSDEQRQAIERDYNMINGCREITVRLSMAYYFIMRMNLDLDDLPPARAQIRLANLDEVQAEISKARAESRTLVQATMAQR